MSKILYYYELDSHPLKRNIPIYLSKEGFDIYHINNVHEIDKAFEEFQPQAILVHNESDAVLLSRASTLPIVVVMETVANPVFVRSSSDSLDTILNTAKLATTL
jgi:hypothetical protein